MRGAGCGACAREKGRPSPLPGGLGSSSGLTTELCRSRLDGGQDEGRRKPAGSGFVRPVPEVRSRGQKSPRRSVERRFADRPLVATRRRPRTQLPRRVFRRSSIPLFVRGGPRVDDIAGRTSAFFTRGSALPCAHGPQKRTAVLRSDHAQKSVARLQHEGERHDRNGEGKR